MPTMTSRGRARRAGVSHEDGASRSCAGCPRSHRLSQIDLRPLPFAAKCQHCSVMGAAHRPKGPDVLIRGHPGQSLAPLPRAVKIAHALAGEDELATREADRDRVAHLPRGRCRRRLIQARHPRCDLALANQRQTVKRIHGHLEVDIAERPPQRLGLGRASARKLRISRQRTTRRATRANRVLASDRTPQQPTGTSQPAIAYRRLAPVRAVLPRKRNRGSCRINRTARTPVCGIRTLVSIDGHVRLIQKERGLRETSSASGPASVLAARSNAARASAQLHVRNAAFPARRSLPASTAAMATHYLRPHPRGLSGSTGTIRANCLSACSCHTLQPSAAFSRMASSR